MTDRIERNPGPLSDHIEIPILRTGAMVVDGKLRLRIESIEQPLPVSTLADAAASPPPHAMKRAG